MRESGSQNFPHFLDFVSAGCRRPGWSQFKVLIHIMHFAIDYLPGPDLGKKILKILQSRVSPNVVDGGGGVIRHGHCLIGHSGDVVGAVRRASPASASLAARLGALLLFLSSR